MINRFMETGALARELDARIQAGRLRDRFQLPTFSGGGRSGKDTVIYLCGNSLGPQPVDTKAYVHSPWGYGFRECAGAKSLIASSLVCLRRSIAGVMDKWQEQGILGFFTPPDEFAHADASVLDDMAALVNEMPKAMNNQGREEKLMGRHGSRQAKGNIAVQ